MILSADERERLRREVDRHKRARIGASLSTRDDGWISIPEASTLVGVKASELRERVRKLGIETRAASRRTMVQLAALERLRD